MGVDTSKWAAEHSAALLGLPAAAAEQEIEQAGLKTRIVGPDTMITLEYRPDRVTLVTDASDVVTEVRPG